MFQNLQNFYCSELPWIQVDTRSRVKGYTTSPTSYRRYIDVETTSCVYWDGCLFLLTGTVMTVIRDTRSTLNRLFTIFFVQSYTARKVSVFGVFLARIFPHSDWIRRDTEYSVQMREKPDQKNSKYVQFWRSVSRKEITVINLLFKY